jgi:Uma2 family endonuclease
MTIPRAGSLWTVEDLVGVPDDGNRYEILDGNLLVSPPPAVSHVLIQDRLNQLLKAHAPTHLLALASGAGVAVHDGESYFIPDVVVVSAAAASARGLDLEPGDVRLTVEVLSQSTRGIDLLVKRREYAEAGIRSYWIVDADERRLTILTLDPGAKEYREEAVVKAGNAWAATEPFKVTLDPADFC